MPLGTEIGLGPGHIVLDGDPSPPKRAHRQFSSHDYNCRQAAGWIKIPHGTKVGIGPGHVVLDGDPTPPPRKGAQPPQFSAHVYCGQTVAHLSYCWALVCFWFSSLLFCFLVPCGRLSWLFVSFWVHVNIVYRIASYSVTSLAVHRRRCAAVQVQCPLLYLVQHFTVSNFSPLHFWFRFFHFRIFSVPASWPNMPQNVPWSIFGLFWWHYFTKKTKRRNFEHNGNPLCYTEVCITSYFVLCHCILCILCVACCRSEILLLLFFDPGIQFPGKKACYAKKNVKLERSLLLLLHKTVLE